VSSRNGGRTTIRRALADIEKVFASVAGRARKAERLATRAANSGRRRMTITRKRRAQLKLQGAYMGFMRQLPARKKAQVKAIKERRGFEAAIKAGRRLAGK
jgi:predicted metalloprotease